jgi:predicted metal-dependent hydrolase
MNALISWLRRSSVKACKDLHSSFERCRKRWGSYTPAGRIVLNIDLVRASPTLIDYVISHELAHAFYPDHGKEWRNLLNMVMPDWENRKARLEAFLR